MGPQPLIAPTPNPTATASDVAGGVQGPPVAAAGAAGRGGPPLSVRRGSGTRMHLRLDPELMGLLGVLAELVGLSRAELTRRLIVQGVDALLGRLEAHRPRRDRPVAEAALRIEGEAIQRRRRRRPTDLERIARHLDALREHTERLARQPGRA